MQRTPAALESLEHLWDRGGTVALHSEALVAPLGHTTSSTPIEAIVVNPLTAIPPAKFIGYDKHP